ATRGCCHRRGHPQPAGLAGAIRLRAAHAYGTPAGITAIPAGHRTAPGEGTARSAPRCAAGPGSRTAGDAVSRARQDRTRADRPGGRRLPLAAGRTARLAVRAAAEDASAGVPQTARTGLGRARTPTRRITSGA